MKLLRLKSNLSGSFRDIFPFTVYTVGTEIQPPLTRMKGFSAHQLFLTVSGTGKFRKLAQDKDKWDILEEGSLLYIPAGCMHEYTPTGHEPWQVAYVTFLENFGGMMGKWGLREMPRLFQITNTESLVERIYGLWETFGEELDEWSASEQLLSLLLDLQKNLKKTTSPEHAPLLPTVFRETVVEAAVQFMHDHLNRPLTIERLAQHVGYSQKQLTRLFRQSFGTTPLQYLHRLRLHAAQMLLLEYPDLTVKQVAAYVGMEPDYFTRLYKRAYSSLPSEDSKSARPSPQ
ncbi:helix-turn-helix domain-containing protein [Paenibacillus sp. CAU 1782]